MHREKSVRSVVDSGNSKREPVHLHPAKAESLTAYGEEFFIDDVKEGEDVRIGSGLVHGNIFLRCDFSAFEEKLKDITPEKLEDLFVQMNKLETQAPHLNEEQRRLLHACWRAARITRKMLGDLGSESVRSRSFHTYAVEAKNMCIKPLSQCKGEAACAEYTLMAHHVLRKLSVKSSIVVGAFADDPSDTFAGRHTFLVLEDGAIVFDPTHSAGEKDCWPPKIFTAETPLTVENLQDMSTEGEDFGHKIRCADLLTQDVHLYGSGAQ